MSKIILASTSPRRKAILELLGIEFEVSAVEVDESIVAGETPYDYVHRLAQAKAMAVAELQPEAIVIGGDVTIDIAGQAFAKAESPDEARRMLELLSGKTHMGRDAFAVCANGEVFASGVVSCAITFKELSDQEISDYLATGEWEGKAGAYAIQGEAAKFVTDIKGSYYDILGLPIYAVAAALMSLGIKGAGDNLAKIQAEDAARIAKINRAS